MFYLASRGKPLEAFFISCNEKLSYAIPMPGTLFVFGVFATDLAIDHENFTVHQGKGHTLDRFTIDTVDPITFQI